MKAPTKATLTNVLCLDTLPPGVHYYINSVKLPPIESFMEEFIKPMFENTSVFLPVWGATEHKFLSVTEWKRPLHLADRDVLAKVGYNVITNVGLLNPRHIVWGTQVVGENDSVYRRLPLFAYVIVQNLLDKIDSYEGMPSLNVIPDLMYFIQSMDQTYRIGITGRLIEQGTIDFTLHLEGFDKDLDIVLYISVDNSVIDMRVGNTHTRDVLLTLNHLF